MIPIPPIRLVISYLVPQFSFTVSAGFVFDLCFPHYPITCSIGPVCPFPPHPPHPLVALFCVSSVSFRLALQRRSPVSSSTSQNHFLVMGLLFFFVICSSAYSPRCAHRFSLPSPFSFYILALRLPSTARFPWPTIPFLIPVLTLFNFPCRRSSAMACVHVSLMKFRRPLSSCVHQPRAVGVLCGRIACR